MSEEKKQNIYTLEGELVIELDRSKSYFETRGIIEEKLLAFKTKLVADKEEILVFDDVGNVKIEGKKFTVPCKVNTRIIKPGFKSSERAKIIKEMGTYLEAYFGIGPKGEKDVEKNANQALREELGIVDVEKFTSFDRKSFEA